MKKNNKHLLNNDMEFFVTLAQRTYLVLFVCCVAMGLFVENAAAGTGGEELQGLYDKVVAITQGYGGKSIAVLGFLTGLYYSVVKHSLSASIPSFGVGILAGVGPTLVTSGISALI